MTLPSWINEILLKSIAQTTRSDYNPLSEEFATAFDMDIRPCKILMLDDPNIHMVIKIVISRDFNIS